MNKQKLTLAVAAAQIVLLGSTSVASEVLLEEVTVTARKKAESLMDAPLAVSVVSGSSMDNTGITNMEQLAARVPGLQLGRGVQTSSIYIRGVGSGLNRGFEQSAGMYIDGIYQVRSRQFTQSLVDLQRVEVLRGPQSLLFGKNTIAGAIKVETASPGLGEGFNGSATVDFEPEFGTTRGTAVLSGDLTDQLAARLALRYQDTDGYVENVFLNEDVAQKEDTLARLSLVWAPSETVTVTSKLSYTDTRGEGTETTHPTVDPSLLAGFQAGENNLAITNVVGAIAAFAVPGFGPSAENEDFESWSGNPVWTPLDIDETESLLASVEIDWDLGDYTFTSLTGYTDFESFQDHDTDFHPGQAVHNLDDEELELFSQEFRISSDFDGRFNFQAGLYYEIQKGTINSRPFVDGTLAGVWGALPAAALNPSFPPGLSLSDIGINSLWNGLVFAAQNPAAAPLIGAEQDIIWRNSFLDNDNETLALFLEFTFDLSDTLSLDIGGRYSEDSKETHKQVTMGIGAPNEEVVVLNPDGSPTGALDPQNTALVGAAWSLFGAYPHDQDLEREETHFDPSVRLRWLPTDDTMAYVSYVEGYKSGGFNSTADSANPDGSPGPGTEFEDEQAKAWELGIKTTTWDGRARLSATLFHTEISDLQVTSFRGTSFIVGNAAEMTSQGVEFETQIALTQDLEVGGSISYLDSEFDDFQGAGCTIYQVAEVGGSCTQDLTGERGPNAPEWSGNMYADYARALGNNLLFTLNAQATYKDEYFVDDDLDPNSLQDSYVKINARIGIGSYDGTWEVALYGRNLTDETSYTKIVDSPLSAGLFAGFVEEPRILGLQARYNF